jgi:nicotinamide-nucleotide amidase
VTIAPYVGRDGIRLRLAVKAADTSAAESLIAPIKAEILRRAGDWFIGEGNGESIETGGNLEQQIADILIRHGWRLGLAESCTGGLISARLTDVPGSSAFMAANIVTYSNEEKIRRLGVRPETLDAVGAVSRETAAEMALGIQRDGGYEFGLSITGFAGPVGELDQDPGAPPGSPKNDRTPGLAYIGVCPAKSVTGLEPSPSTVIVHEVRVNPAYSRSDSKRQLSRYALFFLWKTLRQITGDTKP